MAFLWIMNHNLGLWTQSNHGVFLTYLRNSQILSNSSKFSSFLAKSERSERDTRTDGRRRAHTLFKFEAHLHKKPLRGNKSNCGELLSSKNHGREKYTRALVLKIFRRANNYRSCSVCPSSALQQIRAFPTTLHTHLPWKQKERSISKHELNRFFQLIILRKFRHCRDQDAKVFRPIDGDSRTSSRDRGRFVIALGCLLAQSLLSSVSLRLGFVSRSTIRRVVFQSQTKWWLSSTGIMASCSRVTP